ncbi:putative MFS family arabinose efflux permease [Paenibacillus pabuli]|uniref:Putative MFS family arabinose efflux permease n=2 Tax=Paenibacillus TaxID=44249 RepID=A0A855YEN2_9BACL|nr:putative MFS family arabinose efflux permease [Paenibacillus pabuli]PXW09374.1 putative MFS family arabinose efflux permease [Paenibacillus taichungensis]
MNANTIAKERLPWSALLALAMAGFICILTESLPAGLLPQIAQDLEIGEGLAGQLVTLYAVGSLLAAIPLTTATRGWRRRPLLLSCIFGFLMFNTITAVSSVYGLTLAARFMAGVSAGVLWGMTAGYARRMVSDSLKGKAMAVAMVGTPLALALGVPLGTFLGNYVGWRLIFGTVSLLTVVLVLWVLWKVPDYEGEPARQQLALHRIFVIPGVRPILFVVLTWVLAHNILYTYISPYLGETMLSERVDLVLMIFGVTSVIGIWIIGLLIDRYMRLLILVSLVLFALASLAMGIFIHQPMMIILGVVAWGLTFGGAATLLQTAIAQAGGQSADVAQSMLVTAWNLGIGGGGIVGAILLNQTGARFLPISLILLIVMALLVAWSASKHGFPRQVKDR